MTIPTPNGRGVSPTVLLLCCTAVFVFGCSAAVGIFVAAPEGANTGSLITIVLASVPVTITSLVTASKTFQLADQVADVAQDTNRLANGLGDAKGRVSTADVLRPDLVNPEIRPQLEADRDRIGRAHDERPPSA